MLGELTDQRSLVSSERIALQSRRSRFASARGLCGSRPAPCRSGPRHEAVNVCDRLRDFRIELTNERSFIYLGRGAIRGES